jgi:hypothetical protein
MRYFHEHFRAIYSPAGRNFAAGGWSAVAGRGGLLFFARRAVTEG